MTTNINPATSQSISPFYSSVSSTNASTGVNTSGVSSIGGHRHGHHDQGGQFMQSVMQVLQDLGVALQNIVPSSGLSSSGASQDPVTATGLAPATSSANGIIANPAQMSITETISIAVSSTSVTQSSGARDAIASSTTASLSLKIETSNVQSSTTSSTQNLHQLFHSFIHSLFQALKQAGNQQQVSGVTTADSDNDNSSSEVVGSSNGYNNFNSNLASLISTLSSDAGAGGAGVTTGGSTGLTTGTDSGTTSGAGNSEYQALQNAFNSLVGALHEASTTSTPTLLDFLKKLPTNYTGSAITPIGNSVSAAV